MKKEWNYISCNQHGDKRAALISTLTSLVISHSGRETERCDYKAEFSGADLVTVQTQVSVTNPLYSP